MGLFIYALWSPAGKGLPSWLSFVVSVSLLLSHWYPGSGVVLDCIDSKFAKLMRITAKPGAHLQTLSKRPAKFQKDPAKL